jgi:hypothetical protein
MLCVLICDRTNKVKMIKLKECDEIKGEKVRLISPPMGPTAHWALDLRPDRGRPTLIGWQAPVTLRGIKSVTLHGIKRGGGRRLALRGLPLVRAPHRKP